MRLAGMPEATRKQPQSADTRYGIHSFNVSFCCSSTKFWNCKASPRPPSELAAKPAHDTLRALLQGQHLTIRRAGGQMPLGGARPCGRPHGAAVPGEHVREAARGGVAQAHNGVLRARCHLSAISINYMNIFLGSPTTTLLAS